MKNPSDYTVLAAVAHPDDIEFSMMGTILLLKSLGVKVHFWNLANGCLGTAKHSREEIITIRRKEAKNSASEAGANYHDSIFDDLGIFYDASSLAKVSAIVRRVNPDIILTHPSEDYMEDHVNTCRLVTTAAFGRSAVNYRSEPEEPATDKQVRIYHVLPHGLNGNSWKVNIDYFVDISKVFEFKKKLIGLHQSQAEWLQTTQSTKSLGSEVDQLARDCGVLSGFFTFAEGWTRHNHTGFCEKDYDPLCELLKESIKPS